mgnify:CR=1 FL=1
MEKRSKTAKRLAWKPATNRVIEFVGLAPLLRQWRSLFPTAIGSLLAARLDCFKFFFFLNQDPGPCFLSCNSGPDTGLFWCNAARSALNAGNLSSLVLAGMVWRRPHNLQTTYPEGGEHLSTLDKLTWDHRCSGQRLRPGQAQNTEPTYTVTSVPRDIETGTDEDVCL